MDQIEKEDIIDEYVFSILFDDFSIDRVRPELEARDLNDELIKEIVKDIDDIVLLNQVHIKIEKKQYQYRKSGLGILVTLLATLLYLSYSYGLLNIDATDFWVIFLTIVVGSYFLYQKVKVPSDKFINKNKFSNRL